VLAESELAFTGRDLQDNAAVSPDNTTAYWVVHFELKNERKKDFLNFTRRNVGRLMAIVLDDDCQMAPSIKSEIPGAGIIEGRFDAKEASDLKLLLNAGALPVPLEVDTNRTISPTLGSDTVAASLRAGLAGFVLVLVFMIAYYRLPGLLACGALILYVLLLLAVLTPYATMTLPGVAAFILSIGMAVDANVIIFERLKEELWSGKVIRTAIETGFDRAWTAILDANITTLIITAVLFFLGTSLIKSFAVTLFAGVCCSMFTAVTVTRWLVTMVGSSRLGENRALFGDSASEAK
jgi:protein-export membrane protein SecD